MEQLIGGEFRIQDRLMLEAQADDLGRETPFLALNDVVIEKGGFPRTIRLETSVDGEYLNTFTADGVIVSTPTGSTGYSLSVGGPIVEPDANAIIINPISPHMLANRPLVISGDRTIEITAISEAGEFQITVDGQRVLRPRSQSRVGIRRAPFITKIVLFNDYSFYAVLRNKLHWRNQTGDTAD
jgi:NAD+ kinase